MAGWRWRSAPSPLEPPPIRRILTACSEGCQSARPRFRRRRLKSSPPAADAGVCCAEAQQRLECHARLDRSGFAGPVPPPTAAAYKSMRPQLLRAPSEIDLT